MKKLLFILAFLLPCSAVVGQPAYFDSTYHLFSGGEYARAIFPEGNNYVVFGTTLGLNGAFKPGMIKIDPAGNKFLQATIPDSDSTWGTSFSSSNFLKDSLGGYTYAATCNSLVSSSEYYAGLVRLDANGDTLFIKYLHDSLFNWTINAVVQNPDQTYTLAGAEYISSSNSKLLLIGTDTAGNVLWTKRTGSSSDIRRALSLCHADSGGYMISGYKTSGSTFYGYIAKTDSAGTVLWSLSPGALNCGLNTVRRLQDGNYVACGYNAFYNNGSENFSKCFVIKFTETGSIIWQKTYASQSPTSGFNDFIELSDSSLVFVGHQGLSSNPYYWDALILRTSPDGDSLWSRIYDKCGSASGEMFNSILEKDNGHFIVAGSFWMGCTPDYWVMELDSMGCNVSGCQLAGMDEADQDAEHDFIIYPNPGTGSFFIRTGLKTYSLKLYNITGALVYEHSHSPEQIGIPDLPEGVYIAELRHSNKITRKKIIKI